MKIIDQTFIQLRRKSEGALIGYTMIGIPSPKGTLKIVDSMINGGVDILELGLPFSDPIADGPTIQDASNKALKLGVKTDTAFRIIEQIRDDHKIPLILLTYYNPIYRMGLNNFFKEASSVGLNGIIVPDLPFEESQEYCKLASKYNMDTIFLTSPATSLERLDKIVNVTSGFLYLVSLFGVTGVRKNVENSAIKLVKDVKKYVENRCNLAVGFGISNPNHIKEFISAGADGIIIGSAFVKIINQNLPESDILDQVEEFTKSLKEATKWNNKKIQDN